MHSVLHVLDPRLTLVSHSPVRSSSITCCTHYATHSFRGRWTDRLIDLNSTSGYDLVGGTYTDAKGAKGAGLAFDTDIFLFRPRLLPPKEDASADEQATEAVGVGGMMARDGVRTGSSRLNVWENACDDTSGYNTEAMFFGLTARHNLTVHVANRHQGWRHGRLTMVESKPDASGWWHMGGNSLAVWSRLGVEWMPYAVGKEFFWTIEDGVLNYSHYSR